MTRPTFDAADLKGSTEAALRGFASDIIQKLPDSPEGHSRTISVGECSFKIQPRNKLGKIALHLEIREEVKES